MSNKSRFFSIFVSVSIWAVAFLLCAVFLHNCNRPQFFKVSMADQNLPTEIMERKGIVDWTQLQVDSMNVIHLAANIDSATYWAFREKILREEMKSGRLMTAEQMSERITGYYDKLIDVLIALFVLFSIISYFVIHNKFKKQYEEDKVSFIKDMTHTLLDSQSFHTVLTNGIATKVESHLVTENDIHGLKNQIDRLTENFELLATVYDDLAEKATSKEEIDLTPTENK